ncbi:MAG: Futalosine hydrolase [Gammaproteobacteria bacterium]|nr:Futalosine hydrolase [Gammaproteobacteria bacterium]
MTPAGILTALPAEARTLLGQRPPGGGPSVDTVLRCGPHRLIVCGMGFEHARAGAAALLDAGARSLVSWGCAGALHPALPSGALVLPAVVIGASGTYATDPAWRGRIEAAVGGPEHADAGPLLCGRTVLADRRARQDARERSGASAIDMESAAVGAAALEAGVPFLVVRAIADPATRVLPAFLPAITDAYGRPRLGRLARELLREPSALAPLLALQREFGRALATLRTVAAAARRELGEAH